MRKVWTPCGELVSTELWGKRALLLGQDGHGHDNRCLLSLNPCRVDALGVLTLTSRSEEGMQPGRTYRDNTLMQWLMQHANA